MVLQHKSHLQNAVRSTCFNIHSYISILTTYFIPLAEILNS